MQSVGGEANFRFLRMITGLKVSALNQKEMLDDLEELLIAFRIREHISKLASEFYIS